MIVDRSIYIEIPCQCSQPSIIHMFRHLVQQVSIHSIIPVVLALLPDADANRSTWQIGFHNPISFTFYKISCCVRIIRDTQQPSFIQISNVSCHRVIFAVSLCIVKVHGGRNSSGFFTYIYHIDSKINYCLNCDGTSSEDESGKK